ncbi:synapse-associated protein 47kD isoform X2 [Dermatophagoides farinae]|uniref:synapse-associated protein 47kD isoform X2 n=1 Tax=Dermatophagoides farinae TaxID=6954 RepID=UPI003F5DF65A
MNEIIRSLLYSGWLFLNIFYYYYCHFFSRKKMDFFSNILKNTVNKAETLGKAATAAVNSTLNPTGSNTTTTTTTGNDEQNDNNTTYEQQQQQEDVNNVDVNYSDDQTYTTTAAAYATEELLNMDEKSSAAAFNYAETSQKAIESAKYFGNFIANVASKAGQTVTATAKQLKSTVENVGLMQDFTKEQQEFIKEHGGKTDLAEPPWIGCDDEEKVKVEILSLSQDKRNFVRSPPAGVEFPFDMNDSYPVALALLREDPELAKMRYEIVPKLVNEETFWKNYFYRVSLIKQDPNLASNNLGIGNNGSGGGGGGGTGKASGWGSSKSSSSEGPDDPNDQIETMGETEFISDTFQNSNISVDDVRQDMYKLGIHTNDDIDEELAKDLQEFDFVSNNETGKVDDDEINRELANFDIK